VPLVKVIRHGSSGRARRGGGGAAGAPSPSKGTATVGPAPAGLAQRRVVALVADHERGLRDLEALAQVLRAQLLGARQHDVSWRKQATIGQHPLGPVADEREHHVSPAHGGRLEARGERGGPGRDRAEAPLAPLAGAGALDEREPLGSAAPTTSRAKFMGAGG
jgi:hypothetical protein